MISLVRNLNRHPINNCGECYHSVEYREWLWIDMSADYESDYFMRSRLVNWPNLRRLKNITVLFIIIKARCVINHLCGIHFRIRQQSGQVALMPIGRSCNFSWKFSSFSLTSWYSVLCWLPAWQLSWFISTWLAIQMAMERCKCAANTVSQGRN